MTRQRTIVGLIFFVSLTIVCLAYLESWQDSTPRMNAAPLRPLPPLSQIRLNQPLGKPKVPKQSIGRQAVEEYSQRFMQRVIAQQSESRRVIREELMRADLHLRFKLGLIAALKELPDAQQLWMEIASDANFEEDLRTQGILSALSSGEWPVESVQVIEALASYRDQVGRTALVNLGNFAKEIREREPAYYQRLLGYFASTIEDARLSGDDEMLRLSLLGLGGTADRSQLPIVRQFLSAESLRVRRGAIDAIADLAAPESEEILVDSLLGDPSPQIRAVAAEALERSSHELKMVDSLQLAAFQEEDPDVRKQLAHLLLKVGRHDRRAVGILEWLIDNESDQETYEALVEERHTLKM